MSLCADPQHTLLQMAFEATSGRGLPVLDDSPRFRCVRIHGTLSERACAQRHRARVDDPICGGCPDGERRARQYLAPAQDKDPQRKRHVCRVCGEAFFTRSASVRNCAKHRKPRLRLWQAVEEAAAVAKDAGYDVAARRTRAGASVVLAPGVDPAELEALFLAHGYTVRTLAVPAGHCLAVEDGTEQPAKAEVVLGG